MGTYEQLYNPVGQSLLQMCLTTDLVRISYAAAHVTLPQYLVAAKIRRCAFHKEIWHCTKRSKNLRILFMSVIGSCQADILSAIQAVPLNGQCEHSWVLQ